MTRTKTTKLGITYDLELINVTERYITFTAFCQSGAQQFSLENKWGDLLERDIDQDDDTFIGDLDLSEIENWVDRVSVRFYSSELADICHTNSSENENWHFEVYCFDQVKARIYVHDLRNNQKVVKSFHAYDEQEIEDLITKLK